MLLFLLLLTAGIVKAQWVDDPAQNTVLAQGSNDYGEIYISTNETTGNSFIQWNNMKSNGWSPSLQMVDIEGNPQWGDNGVAIMGHTFNTYSNGIAMTALTGGGVVSAFVNAAGQCIAVKIDDDGTFPWGEAGIVALEASDCTRTELAAGNDGGFWILVFNSNDTYLRYYNADGTPAGSQITISDDNGAFVAFSQMVLDDDNNVFVVYEKEVWAVSYYYNKSIYVAKYSTAGTQLTSETLLMSEQMIGGQISHDVLPDGLGGGYAYICHPAQAQCFEVYTFHFDANGNNTFSNANGIIVSPQDGTNFYLEANGTVDPISHDLIMAFRQTDAMTQTQDALLVNRVTTTGDMPWGSAGITLIAASSKNISGIFIEAFPNNNGAAVIYKTNTSTSPYNYFIHSIGIDGDGSNIWNAPICTVTSMIAECENTSGFHNGQLVMAWEDRRGNTALYGQNLHPDGTLGAPSVVTCNAPTNPIASGEVENVILTWEASPTALSYNVYRDGEMLASITETSYTDRKSVV